MNGQVAADDQRRALTRRVLTASVVGTAIEWYDFFLYGTAAALVFGKLFFPKFDPTTGTIAAFGTFAIGYLARPIGALFFGHYGDRLGRKVSLVLTLSIMGIATFIIGLLPGYSAIGVWAPIVLVAMRLLQGIGVGGEWGGAVLLSVEHAPAAQRGAFGAWPQLGVPIGLLLSTAVFALASSLPNDQFLAWGWRVPFLISIVLVAVGLFIRLRVAESPAFEQIKTAQRVAKAPALEVFQKHPKELALALGTRFATDITFNVMNVFVLSYGTTQLGLPKSFFLNSILVGSAVELFTIPFFGRLSDRIGRRKVYMGGAAFVAIYGFIFFALVETRQPWLIVLAYVLGLAASQASVYAVQSTLFAELFGTRVRYTGASLPYQIAGIITSGPAPLIAGALFASTHQTWPIAGYIAVTALLSMACAYFLAETAKRDLTAIDAEAITVEAAVPSAV